MRQRSPYRGLGGMLTILLLLALVLPAQATPGRLDPRLVEYLAGSPGGRGSFLILLQDQADLGGAPLLLDRTARVTYVYEALRDTAERSQAGLRADLAAWGVDYYPFYLVNAIQVTGDLALAWKLAGRPEVARLVPDPSFDGLDDPPGSPPAPPAVDGVEWNIARVHAPEVWALGYTGQGIVVGSVDTGVDYSHPALVNQYRGNLGGGNFDHNYHWAEPLGTSTAPYDSGNHGTHTTGTMVGDDGAGNQVGMAPGAQWIACKANSNWTWKASKLIACWEWMLAPTDLNGQNPRPDLAAHVVNNSWSCSANVGCDLDTLLLAAQALYAAGIAIVKSGGNTGAICGSLTNPGQYTELLATAAFDSSDTMASFSSRGPVTYGGKVRIKPDVAAPGVSIRSAFPGGGYGILQGTSMAAPHTAGLIALLWSARPALVGDLAATYQAVHSSAEPRIDVECVPNGPNGRPNNVWGWGIIDAYAAVQAGGEIGTLYGNVYDDAAAPLPGALVEIVRVDNHLRLKMPADADGSYAVTVLAATYNITATLYGYLPVTGTGVVVAPGAAVPHDLVLDTAPLYTLTGRVADTMGAPLPATLTLVKTPVTAPTDAAGFYTATVPAGVYTMWASSPGYTPVERAITVTGDLVEDFILQSEPAYALRDSMRPCGPAFDWIEISGSGQPWDLGDEDHFAVSLPRPFTFYGQTYNELFVGSNGQVTFDSPGVRFPGGSRIPQPLLPNNAIYAFWDDLNPAGGSQGKVYTQLVNDRYFVVEYYQVQHFPSGHPETFELILDLDTGVIRLQYLVVQDTRRTTVGVENATGTAGLAYAFHDPAWPTSTQTVAFIPHTGAYPTAQGPGLLRGTVVETGTLAPIAGAAVTAHDWSGAYATATDAAGAYTLTLCAGLYTVTAAAAGYAPVLPESAAVYSGTTAGADFILDPVAACDPVRWADFEWAPYWPVAGRPATFNAWSSNWSRETVDPGYETGQLSSLALDSLEQPHIAYYYTGDSSVLAYARFDGTAWITEVVAPMGLDYEWECMANPLALDAAGRPHIVYNGDGYGLKYTFYEGTAWHVEPVDHRAWAGYWNSLVLDSAGDPRISYMAYGYGSDFGLLYALRLGELPTPPITYTWDLGDGTFLTGPSITHTYALIGDYTVVLTATNCATATATAVHTVTVVGVPRIVLPPAIPTVTLEPGQQATYSFTIANTGTADLSWSLAEAPAVPWLEESPTAGVVGPDDSVEVLLTYTAPMVSGVYTTNLRIASNDPVSPVVFLPVELAVVELCGPVEIAVVTTTITGCTVTLQAGLLGDPPFAYLWALGDGVTSTVAMPTHTYTRTGVYSGTLEAWNCGGEGYALADFAVEVECAVRQWQIYLPLVTRGDAP